jgi:hypothetical protein
MSATVFQFDNVQRDIVIFHLPQYMMNLVVPISYQSLRAQTVEAEGWSHLKNLLAENRNDS